MRQISISIETFSEIWKRRKVGEDSEDEVLQRLLNIKSLAESPNPEETATKSNKSEEDLQKGDIKMINENEFEYLRYGTWWQVIYKGIEEIGGEGTLKEIYDSVRSLVKLSGKKPVSELEATIRGTLEDNCSQSDRYKYVRDVFEMPRGKNQGYWGIK